MYPHPEVKYLGTNSSSQFICREPSGDDVISIAVQALHSLIDRRVHICWLIFFVTHICFRTAGTNFNQPKTDSQQITIINERVTDNR